MQPARRKMKLPKRHATPIALFSTTPAIGMRRFTFATRHEATRRSLSIQIAIRGQRSTRFRLTISGYSETRRPTPEQVSPFFITSSRLAASGGWSSDWTISHLRISERTITSLEPTTTTSEPSSSVGIYQRSRCDFVSAAPQSSKASHTSTGTLSII